MPDFFIVGAPKCGTTAMYGYLRQHPQIYMPFHKEPLYFGSDLTSRYGRMSKAAYVELFASAAPNQRIGEASAWYLYSERAAAEIKEFSPSADIVIMLRNPIDVMHAQHSQLLFNQQEDLHDFSEALAAESDRRAGRRIPPGAVRVENLFYRQMVRFAPQVERYFETFGRNRVHVILYEDFRDQTADTYASLLAFLGVSTTFVADFSVANPNKRVRHRWVQRIVYQPPAPLRKMIPMLRRFPVVHLVRDMVVGWNSQPAARTPIDRELRAHFIRDLTPEIMDLGVLIGRDLHAWIHA